MKRCLLILFISSFAIQLFANVAQPGVRNAGGMGDFTLLFPDDSLGYKKIQMQKERISIQLYRGFAVVKGEYWMLNTTDEMISIRAGYPLNASYNTRKNSSDLTQVQFDKLYQIKVLIDGQLTEIRQSPIESNQPNLDSYSNADEDNWYVWTTEFKPGDLTKIEVYFIVNTNDANVSLGYSKEYYNAFMYVLETGASWKPPIGEGTVMIQLMDGLKQQDIEGASPDSIFGFDVANQTLLYQFTDLEPTFENNIVITYSEKIEDFDFAGIVEKSESYFSEVNKLSSQAINQASFEEVKFDSPFEISEINGVSVIFSLIVFGIPTLLILGIIFIIYKVVKRNRKQNS